MLGGTMLGSNGMMFDLTFNLWWTDGVGFDTFRTIPAIKTYGIG
jgi:hypothetical protein